MSIDIDKNKSSFIIKVLRIIFRKATLNRILLILSAFAIKELTALSMHEDIVKFCEVHISSSSGNLEYYFFSAILILFGKGSEMVLYFNLMLIGIFAVLKLVELKKDINQYLAATLLLLIIGSCGYFILLQINLIEKNKEVIVKIEESLAPDTIFIDMDKEQELPDHKYSKDPKVNFYIERLAELIDKGNGLKSDQTTYLMFKLWQDEVYPITEKLSLDYNIDDCYSEFVYHKTNGKTNINDSQDFLMNSYIGKEHQQNLNCMGQVLIKLKSLP